MAERTHYDDEEEQTIFQRALVRAISLQAACLHLTYMQQLGLAPLRSLTSRTAIKAYLSTILFLTTSAILLTTPPLLMASSTTTTSPRSISSAFSTCSTNKVQLHIRMRLWYWIQMH